MRTRFLTLLSIAFFFSGYCAGQQPDKNSNSPNPNSPSNDNNNIPAHFVDITSKSGVDFQYLSSHTSKKYLIETMGPGVALFDYDNDGRLDIFLVNGAPLDMYRASSELCKVTAIGKSHCIFWNEIIADLANQQIFNRLALFRVAYTVPVHGADG